MTSGENGDKCDGCFSESFEKSTSGQKIKVLIHHAIDEMLYTFGVSARDTAGVGKDCLKNEDSFPKNKSPSNETRRGEQLACAVSARSKVPPGGLQNFQFSLVWDMPKINHWKYYFGRDGKAAPDIAFYSLHNYANEIEKWQNPVLDDSQLPSRFKSALFNETYFVSDGGSISVTFLFEMIDKFE